METLGAISLQAPGAAGLSTASPGALQEGAGFGPLLGHMLCPSPDGTSGGSVPCPGTSSCQGPAADLQGVTTMTAEDGASTTSSEKPGDGPTEGAQGLFEVLRVAIEAFLCATPASGEALRHSALPQQGEGGEETGEGIEAAVGLSGGEAVPVRPAEGCDAPGGACAIPGFPEADVPALVTPSGEKVSEESQKDAGVGGLSARPEAFRPHPRGRKVETPGLQAAGTLLDPQPDGQKVTGGDGPAGVQRVPRVDSDRKSPMPPATAEGDTAQDEASFLPNRGITARAGSLTDHTEAGVKGMERAPAKGNAPSHAEGIGTIRDMMPAPPDLKVQSSGPSAPGHVPGEGRSPEIPGEGVTLLRHDGTSVELSVKVESLGKLRIELMMDDGVVNARIHTADASVKSVIESNLGQLLENLAKAGVSIGNVGVSLREKRQPYEEGQAAQTRQETAEVAPVRRSTPAAAQGLISIYA